MKFWVSSGTLWCCVVYVAVNFEQLGISVHLLHVRALVVLQLIRICSYLAGKKNRICSYDIYLITNLVYFSTEILLITNYKR